MNRSLAVSVVACALVAAAALPATSAGAEGAGRYIVVLKGNADPDATGRDHARAYGAEVSHLSLGSERVLCDDSQVTRRRREG